MNEETLERLAEDIKNGCTSGMIDTEMGNEDPHGGTYWNHVSWDLRTNEWDDDRGTHSDNRGCQHGPQVSR